MLVGAYFKSFLTIKFLKLYWDKDSHLMGVVLAKFLHFRGLNWVNFAVG